MLKTFDTTKILQNLKEKYVCQYCSVNYSNISNLKRHKKICKKNENALKIKEGGETYLCLYCGVIYSNRSNLIRHEKMCRKTSILYSCSVCTKEYTRKQDLDKHYTKEHVSTCQKQKPSKKIISNNAALQNPQFLSNNAALQNPQFFQSGRGNKIKKIHCSRCPILFDSRRELYKHYWLQHRIQIGGQLQSPPWEKAGKPPPWDDDGNIDEDLKETYETHASLILQNHDTSPIMSSYNFPISNDFTIETMMQHINHIHKSNFKSYKINIYFGFVLRNLENGRYRLFKPHSNDSVLEIPFLITRKADLKRLEETLTKIDVVQHILTQRLNTKFVIVLLTNVVYTTFSLTAFTMGNAVTLPNYLKYKKSIRSLERDYRGKLIKDKLCFFRCLTFHTYPFLYEKKRIRFEQQVLTFYNEYMAYMNGKNSGEASYSQFEGVALKDLASLEICFKININIFKLHEDSSCSAIYKSLSVFEDTMHLNQYENHLSYITDICSYSQKFQCSHCTRLFKRKDCLRLHENCCESKRKLCFVGGFLRPKLTIFEELQDYGINVPHSNRFFREFIVFDFESMLSVVNERSTDKLIYTHMHIPVSVSVCSNFKDFQKPICIVNENMAVLVNEMVNYMRIIRLGIYHHKKQTLTRHFTELDILILQWENETGNEEFSMSQKIMLKQLNNLKKRLEKYCSEIPVLGFNSGRYDINLIKSKILECLHMDYSKSYFVVKKNNRYSCISNDEFKFLDVSQFLSPGVSYAEFLRTFLPPESDLDSNEKTEDKKAFFPYEYFQDISQLNETKLPPLGQAWWSSLKNKSILDDGIKSIEENYAWLEETWEKEQMKTFKDFLIWYNNLDVYPFIKALSRLCEFYFEKGVDIFKESISVPGIARKMIFECAKNTNTHFSLIDTQNEDLYHNITANIVGGPSIIFNRFHMKDHTFIRNNPDFACKKILGFDANSLYLFCIADKMPAGGFIRRSHKNNFKPERRDKYEAMFHWMDWLNASQSTHIHHYRNYGKEKRVGPYLVDGFDERTNTVYQYQGCYFHSHSCLLFDKIKSPKEQNLFLLRQKRTSATNAFLKKQGYKVVELYECGFSAMKIRDKNLRKFINQRISIFTQKFPRQVTEKEIIQGVLCGDIFGMVEIDICVPVSWGEVDFTPSSLEPAEYYSEMSPIFQNHDVAFEDVGEFMQKYIIEHGLGKKSKRLLVGGMKAQQILIATPLLIWYLRHGMKVTKIYQVIEYNTPSYCFQEFMEQISSARRLGDSQKNTSFADTMKLIGNSAFGSMIMNKAKHKNIYYVKGIEEASKAVNDELFEKLSEIGADYYEVERFKSKIQLNLPIQIGYFILQLAKLHMLSFYYDFLDKFLERESFQLTQMDTDSLYFAISSASLEDLIKPSMKEKYVKALKGHCTDNYPSPNDDMPWFPRTCCEKHEKFDKRTPGLFKLEYEGDLMISLCSKCYFIGNEENYKFSSKGINKQYITNPKSLFKQALENKQGIEGKNVGFRLKDNGIYTYQQDKLAFSYVYCKRKLMCDGVNTLPLDVTLSSNKRAKIS